MREFCAEVVLRNGRVAATFLVHPKAETIGWNGADGVVGINQHFGVLLGGHLTDEQVVVAN